MSRFAIPGLLAATLLSACGPSEADQVAAAAARAEADQAHFAKAQELIRDKLKDDATVEFSELASYDNEGVNIVCGKATAALPGEPADTQRFIVIGGTDATIELEMEDGEIDKAVTEFCQDFSPMATGETTTEDLGI
jgi:hypothetical protein